MVRCIFRQDQVVGKIFGSTAGYLTGPSLAGCDENAAPLKELYMKNMEIKSSRGFSTLSITNNVPSDQLTRKLLAVFSLLEKGLTMEFAMESIDTRHADCAGRGRPFEDDGTVALPGGTFHRTAG